MDADVLVVGSGASGVNAAVPLVAAGRRVVMLDFGTTDQVYGPLVPARPFLELRRTDPQQHRYFLGDRFEGIPLGDERAGAHLSPARQHISAHTERLLPVEGRGFECLESLARGGLAAGWGAGVYSFGDEDLRDMPLTHADLAPHYEAVAALIGVSGPRDDLWPFQGDLAALMPPAEPDSSAASLLARYARRRARYNAQGLFLGQTRLALCTRPLLGRMANQQLDLEFWGDPDRSVYRPQWTLEELRREPSFTYLDRRLVLRFAEQGAAGVEVVANNEAGGAEETHRAKALILAAGSLSTARLVLRSLDRYETRVPLLCNPSSYCYLANLNLLGREPRDLRHSLSQLTAVYRPPDPDLGMVQASYYSYRSLLLYRLCAEVPLPFREGREIMRRVAPLVGVLLVQYEDRAGPAKQCFLQRAEGGDRLVIDYHWSAEEQRIVRDQCRVFLRWFRRLGCLPVKVKHPPPGYSIHYAGTFPMRADGGELTCDEDCRLRPTERVYLADGAPFAYLPAKGLTFTLMANAHRVGTLVSERLG
ncbi:MAG: hypothetical protein HYU66_14070 [Armatimonadetes bacterium]|nr:hypothetical protein [Armatimonadota bacterium]